MRRNEWLSGSDEGATERANTHPARIAIARDGNERGLCDGVMAELRHQAGRARRPTNYAG